MEQPGRSARRSSHRFWFLLGCEVIVERLRLIPGPPRRSRCPGGARRLHGTALRAHRELPAAERLYTASHEAPGFHPTGPRLNLFGTEPAPPRRPQPHINGFGGTERSRADAVPGQPNSGLGEKSCCTEMRPSRGFLRAVRRSERSRCCGTGVAGGLRGDHRPRAEHSPLPAQESISGAPSPAWRFSPGCPGLSQLLAPQALRDALLAAERHRSPIAASFSPGPSQLSAANPRASSAEAPRGARISHSRGHPLIALSHCSLHGSPGTDPYVPIAHVTRTVPPSPAR